MGKQEKILVVDDSKLMRSIVGMMLKKGGYEVCEAEDGKEALSTLIRNRDISMITLDVEMPVMDGFETCRHIRMNSLIPAEIRNIPILFITSRDSIEDRRKGFELGATDFLGKEFLEAEILPAVKRILTPSDRLAGVQALVVDDSFFSRKIVSRALHSSGVLCTEAENGREAYELLKTCSTQFDLVILDLDMPEMNGLELVHAIRKELGLHDIPVIMLSANENKVTQLELFNAGATDYLTKPFIKEELIGRMNAHLEVVMINKKLKESLRRIKSANKIINDISQERKELLHVMCHDLANPIGAIISVLDMVGDNAEMFMMFREELKKTAINGLAMIDLVRKMRALDENKIELKLEEVSLKNSVQSSLSILQAKMNDKHIMAEVDIDDGITVMAEETSLIGSVLNNIVSNAVKFSYEGGRIDINAKQGEHYTELIIRDYGIGMPDEIQNKLFDNSHNVSRTGTSGEAGTGFGMSLVKKFVKHYGGRITVRSWDEKTSADKHGTEIRLKLENG